MMKNNLGWQIVSSALILIVITQFVAAETIEARFPYSVEVLDANYNGHFSRIVEKEHVLIFGDHVEISESVLTNGGDVIIVADKLTISAQIDTRVSFTMVEPFWDQAKDSYSPLTRWGRVLDTSLAGNPKAWEPIADFMLWHEYYDSDSRLSSYRAHEFAAWWPEFSTAIKHQHSAPGVGAPKWNPISLRQLPSAQIPSFAEDRPYNGNALVGSDAKRSDNAVLSRSGNISIYASEIEFCPECNLEKAWFNSVPRGDLLDRERHVFLITAGLKGGYGSLGLMEQCGYAWLDCHSEEITIGKRSGAPGSGGDAGSIDVHYVNPASVEVVQYQLQQRVLAERAKESMNKPSFNPYPPSADKAKRTELAITADSIAWLSSYRAGAPPSWNTRRITEQPRTAFNGGNRTSNNAFKPAAFEDGDNSEFEERKGMEGRLIIDEVDSNTAIQQIVSLISLIDSEPRYDYGKILNRFKESAHSDTIYFSSYDVLLDYLSTSLASEQLRFLARLKANIEGKSELASRGTGVLSSLDCEQSKWGSLPAALVANLTNLCLFSTPNGDALRTILEFQNGVFGSTSDPFPSLLAGHQTYATYDVVEAVHAVQIDLAKIGRVVNDFSENAQMKELRKEMSMVLAEIARLYDENNAENESLLDTAGPIAFHVKSAVEAYYKSDWAEFAKSAYSAVNEMSNSDVTGPGENVAWLKREELEVIRREMNEVSAKAFDVKNSLLSSESWALSNIQAAVESRRAIKARASSIFPILLHLALLEELRLPSHDGRVFLRRLGSIGDLIENYPDENQQIGIGVDVLKTCDDTWFDIEIRDYEVDTPLLFPSDCLTINSHTGQFTISGRLRVGELSTTIPLYFYQPTVVPHSPIKVQMPPAIGEISIQRP